jgi:hypothetical protein
MQTHESDDNGIGHGYSGSTWLCRTVERVAASGELERVGVDETLDNNATIAQIQIAEMKCTQE